MKPIVLLDPLIHTPLRLAVMTILAGVREADFTYLRETTGTTDGNLSTHLSKLEEAGYISVTRSFERKKPKSRYALTPVGRKAHLSYLDALENYIRITRQSK